MLKEMLRKEDVVIEDISGLDLIWILVLTMVGAYAIGVFLTRHALNLTFKLVDFITEKKGTKEEIEA